MPLSARTSQLDTPNRLSTAIAAARDREWRGGPPLADLTVSNPTTAGLPYASKAILGALADPAALVYAPEPLGLASAREAAASYSRRTEPTVEASRIALTASTSEAYAVLFKILCDPGDEVLVPSPSYPLLAFLSAFESVRLVPYPLLYAGRWHVDLDALRGRITPRTKAIVIVNPNNPTGSYIGRGELDAMLDLGLPIVSDEVFAAYPLDPSGVPEGRVGSVLGASRGMVFGLSGLSKAAALPQMKLGWIGVAGEPSLVTAAMGRLELVLDAFLSVGSAIQHALPTILACSEVTASAIRARIRVNLAVLIAAAAAAPMVTVLHVEGGWYAIVRVPETRTDEEWAIDLVERAGVIVQPGYFFDMERGAYLVLSLLTPEDAFASGVEQALARIASTA